MNRRVVPAGLLLMVCFSGLGCRESSSTKPGAGRGFNVLLITLDTTRADALGCYGNRTVQTPALDTLAREGVLFSQCTTCAPITLPSHASILTATYPFVHGTRLNGQFFADEGNVTLAEILKDAGYATGAEVAAYILDGAWGINQGFASFRGVPVGEGKPPGEPRPPSVMAEEPADRVCARALEWLDPHSPGPFFLWVHFFDPHFPYAPPEAFKGRYQDPYLGEVAFMDTQIGRLMDRLKALGLDRKTLVAVVGDHGEAFKQHREGTHMYFVYDSTMHVPLILRCPGTLPRGRRGEAQVRTVDITPTILDLLGLPAKPDAQGVSLLPLISGREKDLHLAAYGETMSPHLDYGYAPLRCLRSGGWKYIHAPQPELYDVVKDPGETVSLLDQYPDRAADLREELRKLIAEAPPAVSSGRPAPVLDPQTVARLASLGYLSGATADAVGDEPAAFADPKGPDPKDRINVHIQFMLADAYATEGPVEKAVEILEGLVHEEPENPAVWERLADLRRDAGRLEAASALYAKVLELRPNRVGVRVQLGRTLGALERLDEALEHLQRAAEQAPQDARAQTYLAWALAQKGRGPQAQQGFRRALELDPKSTEACLGLSGLMEAQGRFREAIQVLREGLRHSPWNVQLSNNLAWLLAVASPPELRNGVEAVRLAETVCGRPQAEDPELLDTLAAAYAEAGRFSEAVQTARRAVELAVSLQRPDLAEPIRPRLALYEVGKPYHMGE